MTNHIPSFYQSGYVPDFSPIAQRYGLAPRRYARGQVLTTLGTINNTAYYVQNGILHFSLIHSSGNHKAVSMFGAQTLFPMGVVPHENPLDYELLLQAFTDVVVYPIPYPLLGRICTENGAFAATLLAQNCDFVGYLFYREMSQSYLPARARVCDILYLYSETVQPHTPHVPFSQRELASLVGVSTPQLERILHQLRAEKIVATARKQITILDKARLAQLCSDELTFPAGSTP